MGTSTVVAPPDQGPQGIQKPNRVEKKVRYRGLRKRFDMVVFDEHGKPLILIECKAPEVALSQETILQIARYNREIQAPHLLLTNGVSLLFFSVDENGKFQFQKEGWFE
jgi:hypothetical protein